MTHSTPLPVFKLENYLAEYEFKAPHLLCCSDAQSWSLAEILAMANAKDRALWDNLTLGYTEAPGHPLLRQTIAETIFPNLHAHNILVTSGAEEGIFCTFSSLCEQGDHAIVLTPCYQSLYEIPKSRGCSITTIALREENDWRIDLDAIRQAIQPNTKWLIMNFPHNPTGQIITEDELQRLIQLLDHHGIWLFSDEAYRLLGPSSTKWAPPAASLYPRAISLGVMSKAYGMAGLRIGWVACQDPAILKRIEQMRHYTSICCSGLSEIVSIIALHNQDTLLKRNNTLVEENLKLIDSFMKEQAHRFSWVRPQGGCVGFVKYHGPETADAFANNLIEETGVLLLPGSIYDLPGEAPLTNHFRIGFGRANMPAALECFQTFIERHKSS